MSCEDYCPEVHNDPDFEIVETSDTSSNEEQDEAAEVKKKLENKVQNMIKKEVNEKFKVPDRMDHPAFKEIRTSEFDKLSEEEKINKVAIAFHQTGGIDISNILELKMLMV